MNKQDFMEKYDITIREVTKKDVVEASTVYQRSANYVIAYPNGIQIYSQHGTLKDVEAGLKFSARYDIRGTI